MTEAIAAPANASRQPVTSIFRQIISPLVAVMIALAVAVTWLTYASGRDAVDRLVHARLADAVQRADDFIGGLTQEAALVTRLAAQPLIANEIDLSDRKSVEAHLFRYTAISQRAPYMYVADTQGGFIGVNRARPEATIVLEQRPGEVLRMGYVAEKAGDRLAPDRPQTYDSRSRPWYKLAQEASSPIWTPVYASARTGIGILTFAIPIHRPDRELRGVFAMNLPLDSIERLLLKLEVAAGARVMLLESDGGFVGGTANATILSPVPPMPPLGVDAPPPPGEVRRYINQLSDGIARATAEHVLAAGPALEEGLTAAISVDGEDVFVAGKRIKRNDTPEWIIAIAVPRNVYMSGVLTTLTSGIGLAILALLAAVALGIFTVGRVTRDIRTLRAAAEDFKSGRWDAPLPVERGDELGVLANSFGAMRDEVRASMKTIREQNESLEKLNVELEHKVEERTAAIQQQALELAAKNEQLEDAVRLREDVDRIARHDLRTPINSIVAVPKLLREGRKLSAEEEELIALVEQSGYRILNMVNLSLDLYRMERGTYHFRPQPVELLQLVERVARDLREHAAAKRVAIRILANGKPYLPGDRVHAWAEEVLCYSIIANLLKNAVEASPDGTEVVAAVDCDDRVTIRITNAGEVPPQMRERFFEKYASAGKAGGTGLGTYSARLIARVQEGDLAMSSSPASGTTLTLTLKTLPEDVPVPATAAIEVARDAVESAELPPLKVLVADDDEYNLLVMRRYLPSPPIQLSTAVNGRAALEAVEANPPDLIFMDMDMPVMGGLEAVGHIRAAEKLAGRGRAAIVAFSSYDYDGSSERALAAGCDQYLAKPVTRQTVHRVIRAVANSQSLANMMVTSPFSQPLLDRGRDVGASADGLVMIDPDLRAALPGFLASRKAILEQMSAALAADDRAALRAHAHRLAGSLGIYGFNWASAQALQIERNAHSQDKQIAQGIIDALQRHLANGRIAFNDNPSAILRASDLAA